jgi:hypothetical protein
VEGHPDVELLDQRLEGVDGVGRFGGDGIKAKSLGELEQLPAAAASFGMVTTP